MQPKTIEALILRGAQSLADGLQHYWPTTERSELCERNLTLHVGASFLAAGFSCYTECRWDDAHPDDDDAHRRTRLDLLGWHREERTLLLVEAKRLFSVQGVAAIVEDIRRINAFRPREGIEAEQRLAVILASTWNPRITAWWTAKKDDPWEAGTEAWNRLEPARLRRRIEESGIWSSFALGTVPAEGREHMKHSLLYGIFDLA